MAKKVIILGANGMAGHVITAGFNADASFEVISVARSKSIVNPTMLMDVADFDSLSLLIKNSKADVVINCIGLLNKTAEDKVDQAILVNSYLPHFLEAKTRNTNTKVIHISTDCVFSGEEGGYTEESFKNGKGFYAQSKSLGELNNSKDLTFRTSIIGPELKSNGIGLFHWFCNQYGIIYGFTNAFWTGITTIELFNAIKISIEENLTGVYHLVNDHKISKFELITIFNDVFKRNLIVNQSKEYTVDKSLINTRTDFSFKVNSYQRMIEEMKVWIYSNTHFYPHYDLKV